MNITVYPDARSFLDRACPFLEEREGEYNLILATADALVREESGRAPFLAVAADAEDRVDCVALMTPPWQVQITRGSRQGLAAIVGRLLDDGWDVPGVQGPEPDAELFASIWSERTGDSMVEKLRLRIYELTDVIMPNDVPGRMRQAVEDDLPLFLEWVEAFHDDAKTGAPPGERTARGEAALRGGRLFFWEVEGVPVSMALWNPSPPRGGRISYVYTPRDLRRHGYAGAVTAALSKHLLDSGLTRCFLFTDLSNPTSNSIYRNIGYRTVSDNRHYLFVKA